ncbi:hypothetical protein DVH24_021793 [Malus domestica]|uniref:Uncharacterized protein n=1 Tax=Malus domestica TaxID=3750 RepID=A0A498ITK4_MALDO|nr:hypothetical protein DVH24_021793 [Malus domestica]
MLQSMRRRLVGGEGMLGGGSCSRKLGFFCCILWLGPLLFVGSIGLVWQI